MVLAQENGKDWGGGDDELRAEAIAWHAFAERPAEVAEELRGLSRERVKRLCAQIQSGCGCLLQRRQPELVELVAIGKAHGVLDATRDGASSFSRSSGVGRFIVKDLTRRALLVYPEEYNLHAAMDSECWGVLAYGDRVFTALAGGGLQAGNRVALSYVIQAFTAEDTTTAVVSEGGFLVRVESSGRKLRQQRMEDDYVSPVSYTHLTLPTNREVVAAVHMPVVTG